MTEQLGIGVLGLHEGRTLLIALNHIIPSSVGLPTENKYRAPLAKAVAGCDLESEKIQRAKMDCPDLFYTSNYEALLAQDDVDIVAIYTPDSLHCEHIAMAFEAGKDVICTKPIVNSVEDAKRVWEVSQRTNRKLLVGQSTRFFESFKRQRNACEEGEIGEIEFVDAHYIHRMDWFYDKSSWATHDTDWVFLGMSHPIDLIRWYLGPIDVVHAIGSKSSLAHQYNVESYDIYSVNFVAQNGKIGRAMGNYGLHELPSARNAIELMLYGSDGTSLAQYHDMRYSHVGSDGIEIKEDMLYHHRGYYFNNEVHGMHYGEFANYTQYFATALHEKRDYSPNLAEGLETFCIMEAVRESALTGKPVHVAPLLEKIGIT